MDDDTHKIRVTTSRDLRSAPPVSRAVMEGMRPAMARMERPMQRPVIHQEEPVPVIPDTSSDDKENPEEIAPEESPTSVDTPNGQQPNKLKRLLNWYWRHKLWTLPLTILLVVAIIFAIPTSRYKVLAYFVSKPFSVTVTDSTTGTPITGATVKIDGKSTTTDGKGKASLTVPVGNGSVNVSKTYYQSMTKAVLVDLTGKNSLSITLVATGRQVPVKVINKITGKPISEVVLTFASTNAKTDANGQATVVLPTSSPTQAATLTVDGYINLPVKVQITTQVVSANTFAMVPNGRMYFLSNLSGKLDVVSTNLDGSDRKTVLAGTGSEDRNNTVLLASRDWQYLALLSKRDGSTKLYLITAATGNLTTIDSTDATYALIGWNNHYFAYSLYKPSTPSWQAGSQAIQSYNADTNKSATLATSKATGTSTADAQYQSFGNEVFLGSNIIFPITWYTYGGGTTVAGQQNLLMSYKVDGTGSKTLKSVDAGSSLYISTVNLANPEQIYFTVFGTSSNYYRLDTNGNITQSSSITADTVNQSYPTYLISPTSKFSFWTSVRDGKNTLFVGDYGGSNGNQIASLSDYAPYGWYTDDYLLVQKNNSELYIMPAAGGTPQKISDYFKPDYYIYGYGGGYGGF